MTKPSQTIPESQEIEVFNLVLTTSLLFYCAICVYIMYDTYAVVRIRNTYFRVN